MSNEDLIMDVNQETTTQINDAWGILKDLRMDSMGIIADLSSVSVPYVKNKIRNLLEWYIRMSSFYMSPFSNHITAYGLYFDIDFVRDRDQRETKLIVPKELVPIPDNWLTSDEPWSENSDIYPDNAHDTNINIIPPDKYLNHDWIQNNRCNIDISDELKDRLIDIINRWKYFSEIEILQYAMNHTAKWKERSTKILEGERIIGRL